MRKIMSNSDDKKLLTGKLIEIIFNNVDRESSSEYQEVFKPWFEQIKFLLPPCMQLSEVQSLFDRRIIEKHLIKAHENGEVRRDQRSQ